MTITYMHHVDNGFPLYETTDHSPHIHTQTIDIGEWHADTTPPYVKPRARCRLCFTHRRSMENLHSVAAQQEA